MVRRLAWVGMSSARSLSASRDAVIGRPGRSPGNSQRLSEGDPIPTWGLPWLISLSNSVWSGGRAFGKVVGVGLEQVRGR